MAKPACAVNARIVAAERWPRVVKKGERACKARCCGAALGMQTRSRWARRQDAAEYSEGRSEGRGAHIDEQQTARPPR